MLCGQRGIAGSAGPATLRQASDSGRHTRWCCLPPTAGREPPSSLLETTPHRTCSRRCVCQRSGHGPSSPRQDTCCPPSMGHLLVHALALALALVSASPSGRGSVQDLVVSSACRRQIGLCSRGSLLDYLLLGTQARLAQSSTARPAAERPAAMAAHLLSRSGCLTQSRHRMAYQSVQ